MKNTMDAPGSVTAGFRNRRTARAARDALRQDLASYTSTADLDDLDAIVARHSEEETGDIRRILAARRAA